MRKKPLAVKAKHSVSVGTEVTGEAARVFTVPRITTPLICEMSAGSDAPPQLAGLTIESQALAHIGNGRQRVAFPRGRLPSRLFTLCAIRLSGLNDQSLFLRA